MSKYSYSLLSRASGTVNVIGVVKYLSQPKKTRGSGYSIFIAITDPSLNGAKLPCVIFNDSKENLPVVHSPGDVIIMHRLVIKSYQCRSQGCGYDNAGFRCAVFSGAASDPLQPVLSASCAFGEYELEEVRKLHTWFNSPDCPVERELSVTATNSALTLGSSSSGPGLVSNMRRLNALRAVEFCTIEGQVISIYTNNEQRYVVIYIWDGSFAHQDSKSVFFGPRKEQIYQILPGSKQDPSLAVLTGHGLYWSANQGRNLNVSDKSNQQSCDSSKPLPVSLRETEVENFHFSDWSVPIFVYDEHVSGTTVTSLQPGDLVRVHNVHVTHRHNELLNISQLCNIPSAYYNEQIFCRDLDLLYPPKERICPSVCPSSWIQLSDDSSCIVVCARLVARVVDASPLNMNTLKDSLVLICPKCRKAARVSCVVNQRGVVCKCDSHLAIFPFCCLHLEDPSGSLLLNVCGQSFIKTLLKLAPPDVSGCMQTSAWWANLVMDLPELQSLDSYSKYIECIRSLLGQWIDIVVKVSWTKPRPYSDDLDDPEMKFQLLDWDEL